MIYLEKDEKLVAVFRKHLFYIGVKIVGLIILGLIPLLVMPFIESIVVEGQENIQYLITWIYMLYLAVLWVIGFVMWTEYYLDMWLLTDKRLIDVEQIGLFAREISSLRLDRIQDVKVQVVGILDTALHIGTVHVQTAGSEKEFVIPSAKAPNEIKRVILDAHNKKMEEVKTVRVENS